MQAIKALVIFMGVLLVAGFGLLGWGLYTKAQKISDAGESQAAELPAPSIAATPIARSPSFGDVAIALPHGAVIGDMEVVGGRVVLRIGEQGGGTRLLVIDPANGIVAGSFQLMPSPTP